MPTKPKQIDLEEAIAKLPKRPQPELHDAFTGQLFQPKSRNHYEQPDPKPFAPNLQIERPTVRQRIENLISRGVDPLQDYVQRFRETDDLDFDVPDDPEAPLTHGEQAYLDIVAADLAEAAPMPDDGLPRPQPGPTPAAPSGVQGAAPPAPGAAPGGSDQAQPGSPVAPTGKG